MEKVTPEKWMAALRSGKYQQQREHRLRAGDSFCCLGVLCDITDPSKWNKSDWYDSSSAFVPDGISGLRSVNGRFTIARHEWVELGLPVTQYTGDISLSELNDGYGFTFAQIADVIEKYKERIFHIENGNS